jgi:ABC-type transport system substrate-binding protein
MKDDSNYQTFSMYQVKDVPNENLEYLLRLFLNKASVNMGTTDLNEKKMIGCIEIIKTYYPYIPICYIASGIVKGSLGHFGAGYLVPRTVYGWMNEISKEYNQDQAKQSLKQSGIGAVLAADLDKFPAGKAICQKIDWYRTGKLKAEQWEQVSLHQLVDDIAMRKNIKIENYL